MFYFHKLLLNLKFMLDKIHPIFFIQRLCIDHHRIIFIPYDQASNQYH